MIRKIIFLLLALCTFAGVYGQGDSSHLRISLLTCGPGDEEVWEVFGHTGVRVIDSNEHTDVVFNYGTFEYGPDFELQFMRGKLLYSVSIQQFGNFMQEYIEAKRSVDEQVLMLDWKTKEHIYYFLKWNAEPENKYYKYDFFFDNCATRIRDIFTRPEVLGAKFSYGNVVPPGSHISFRDIINIYFFRDHWTRTGVNILLGSKIDKVMSNKEIMFLPDYLRDGLAGATAGGKKVAAPVTVILPRGTGKPAGFNWPLLLTCCIALLTILGLTIRPLRLLGKGMSILLLLVTGLLGCLILVMWFGTDHQGCGDNFNVLWCLPTNIFVALFNPKGKGRYALIGIFLILVTLLLSLIKVQGVIIEFLPVLLALLFVYGSIFKASKINKTSNANN